MFSRTISRHPLPSHRFFAPLAEQRQISDLCRDLLVLGDLGGREPSGLGMQPLLGIRKALRAHQCSDLVDARAGRVEILSQPPAVPLDDRAPLTRSGLPELAEGDAELGDYSEVGLPPVAVIAFGSPSSSLGSRSGNIRSEACSIA